MDSDGSTAPPAMNPPILKTEKSLHEGSSPADSQSVAESLKGDVEKQTPNSTASGAEPSKSDDASTYPPTREALPIMLALYLAMFLTALVSLGGGEYQEELDH